MDSSSSDESDDDDRVDTKKSSVKISKIDETRRRIILNEQSEYYGLIVGEQLFILNFGQDGHPKSDTRDYQWCHLAFHVISSTRDRLNCFMSSDGKRALVCTAPPTEAPVLVVLYTLRMNTYNIDRYAGSLDERWEAAWTHTLELIESVLISANTESENLELIENLIIAPVQIYEKLERILATALAKIDPKVVFPPEAESLYRGLIKLLKTRPPSAKSSFPDVFHLMTASELKKTMDTLQKWNKMGGETDRIKTATHTVIHALYAIRTIRDDKRALNLLMAALANDFFPQPTRKMTLSEAVVTVLSWFENLETDTEWGATDWATNFFQNQEGVLTFHFSARPHLLPGFLRKVEQAVSAVFDEVQEGTLNDPPYSYTHDGKPLRYSSADDIVTLYVESASALKEKVADYCNITSDIFTLPLLCYKAGDWRLQLAVLEPTENLDIAKAINKYSYFGNRRPAFLPVMDTFMLQHALFCEIFRLTAYHDDHKLIDVHLSFFFYNSIRAAKDKFLEKCGGLSKEKAPRLLTAIRDASFDLGALSMSLEDAWEGRLKQYPDQEYTSADLKKSAGKRALSKPSSPESAALYDRHGEVPNDLAGMKTTPKSAAMAVLEGGYYGRIGFLHYDRDKFGKSFDALKSLPPFSNTSNLHVCPRPALVTVQFTYEGTLKTVVLSIPWSYSTHNARELICEHIAREINQDCDCKLKAEGGEELSAETDKMLLYQWHTIERELTMTATVERKAAKRPASTSPQRPERERSPRSYDKPGIFFELKQGGGAPPLRLASFVDTCF